MRTSRFAATLAACLILAGCARPSSEENLTNTSESKNLAAPSASASPSGSPGPSATPGLPSATPGLPSATPGLSSATPVSSAGSSATLRQGEEVIRGHVENGVEAGCMILKGDD